MKTFIFVSILLEVLGFSQPEVKPPDYPDACIVIEQFETGCTELFDYCCWGWPVECGHKCKFNYCPLRLPRNTYLHILDDVTEENDAYLVNFYLGSWITTRLGSTWVFNEDPTLLKKTLTFDITNSNLPDDYTITWYTPNTYAMVEYFENDHKYKFNIPVFHK